MSTQTARGLPAGQTDEERIERYLTLNPDFFERHQPLLARMRLPHMRTGSTVSLVERQVEVLRDQKTDADRRLAEFIAVARANDQLAERIHRFTRRLLRATTAASAMTALEASLREDFDAFHSVLLLTAPVASLADTEFEPFLRKLPADDANMRTFEALLATGKPRCGQVRDTQRDFLFGPEAASIGSVALVPLGEAGSLGLLALGSAERERFHPGMSTEFLKRMGELITDALSR
ncbi:MAG TPA: DUF484 family protein [Steroidobacteraceae bacterium]|jgi:uncharacterized protein YigA (DUF484 family)|nr:DUF484 family protein [Steroidobacteraceae bacterium]